MLAPWNQNQEKGSALNLFLGSDCTGRTGILYVTAHSFIPEILKGHNVSNHFLLSDLEFSVQVEL